MEPIRVTSQAGKAPETYGEGRVCVDCGCRLSRYNRYETCSQCSPPDYRPERMTPKRTKKVVEEEPELEATG